MRKKFLLMVLILSLFSSMGGGCLYAQVAKVGNTEYATIDDAVANWTNGTTLTLLADVTLSDVIKLSSTEYHILDLGSYTMTAASGKDAIQYVVNGRSSAGYALDIKADATNPGGITATNKTIVSHIKPSSGAPSKDRPITRFYGGVFNASYVVKQGGSGSFLPGAGYTGASAPYFQFYGGVFNGAIYTNRSQNQFHGGVFNGSIMMSVDSSAYTLVAGGTFKNLSNSMNSALNSDKFTIGSAKGVYDKEVYIDDNGNYVIAAAEPSQGIEADVAKTPGTNDYLAYSKVATEGQLGYTDVYTALENNKTAEVIVYTEELDLEGSSFTGTIVVPENSTIAITNAPETLIVKDEEGNVLEPKADGSYTTVLPQGRDFSGYTRTDAIWGEVWGNASESFVIKVLDANDNVMGTTSLNNVGGIIDGDVEVTWSLKLDAASNTDEYWTMEWTTTPTIDNMPAKVELWVDGVKVSGGDVVLNGPDEINKIYVAVTDNEGKIYSYHVSIANAVDAIIGTRSITPNVIALLRDTDEIFTLPAGVTLNLNGHTADNATVPVAQIGETTYYTLEDAVAAAESGTTITLLNGEHELPLFSGKELTFIGESKDGVIVNDAPDARTQGWNGSTFHFENLTAKGATANYHGLANGVVAVTYEDCVIKGLRFLYAPTTFTGCAFNADGVEHSFWTYGSSEVAVTNCTFTYTDRAVNCYSENGANHELDITFSGCTFTYAGTADAPEGAVEINSGSVKSIDVVMNGCTAPAKGAMWFNSQWDSTEGANTVVVVDGEIVWIVSKGTLTNAYTSGTGYWGECGGNAYESFVFKFYNDDTYMGQTSLNDVNNIIDGDVYVSWSIKLDAESNTDDYWEMSWDIRPTLAMQPNRVEQWVDDVKVAACVVEPNWSDRIFPVVAAVTDENGVILSYVNGTTDFTLQDALNAGADGETITMLDDVTLDETVHVYSGDVVTLDLNGKTIDYNPEVWVYGAANSGTALLTVDFGGELVIEDSSTEKTGTLDASYSEEGWGISKYDVYGAVMMTAANDNAENGTAKLTVNGGTLKGFFAAIAGNRNRDNTEITINDGYLTAAISESYGTAGIEHPMNGKLTINGGTIEGMDGISLRSGTLVIIGGTIIGNAPTSTFDDDGYWDNNFAACTGHALQIVNRANNEATNETPSVTISGGNFTSENNTAVGSYASVNGTTPDTKLVSFISGGNFSGSTVIEEDLLAPGFKLEQNEDGTYSVVDDPDTHYISSLEGLKAFRDDVNNGNKYQGVTVYLEADIDLAEGQTRSTESNWTPISQFNGTFDGQGHTISNLVIDGGSSSNQGFFGQTNNGEIKNVIFENAKVSGRLNVGVVAGTPYTSKYTHVKVTGHVEVEGMAYVGGVGGKNAYADWTDITVDVDETSYVKATSTENGTAYRTYVGGVIGFNGEGGHTFKNISSNIKVIGDVCDIGGIFGIVHYNNKVENVSCSATVESTGEADELGGIAGVWHNEKGTSVTMNDVEFTGTVKDVNGEVEGVAIVGGAYNADNETPETSGSLIIDGQEAWLLIAKIGDTKYSTFAAALNAVQNDETITLLGIAGDEKSTEIDFTKDIEFTITGTAPNYALPVVTFQNAKVNIKDATILTPELDARQNATINVVNSTVYDAGGNGIVKSYYNGAINLDNSVVYTMQVTTMGYINITNGSELNATWQTNVYGNGLVTIEDNATFNTAALHLTAQDYSGRDNTDAERVGKPAEIVVDGANFTVGRVYSDNGADYSYNSSKGINVGTVEGKSAILNIKNGGNVNIYMANGETTNFGAGATVNVNASTLNTACRAENGTVTLANAGTVYVTGASNLAAAKVTGDGWFYMNGVSLDADTKLLGAKVGFINGTNNIVGSTIDDGWFSVGIGQNAAAETAATFAEANGIELGNVEVNVSEDAIIGSGGSAYNGWVGSAYSADKSQHTYTLNVENSLATFGYMHVSKDGAMTIKGHSNNKYTYDNANVDFYAGELIVNGIVTLDGTDAWSKFTKMSVDHADGVLNIANATNFESSIHNGSNTSTSLKFWKAGEVNIDATSIVEIDNGTVLVEGAKLNIASSNVTAKGAVTGNGEIKLTDLSAKFTAQEGLTVTNGTENDDIKVVYKDGAYQFIEKVYVAQIGEGENAVKFESLQEAIEAVEEDETITMLKDVTVTEAAYGQNALNHARAISFTLDLNGKTLSANTGNSVFRFNIANSGATSNVTVTVKNGKVVSGADTWCALMASGISADVKAVMNLEDLTIENYKGGDFAVKAWANGVINAKNVTINASYGGGFYALGGEITLDNCKVEQKGLWTAPYLSMTIGVSNGGKMTVNSGTYSAVPVAVTDGNNQGTSHGSWCGGVMSSGGTLIINGGTFSNGNIDGTASYPRALFTIGADADYGDNVAANLTINGGTFTSIGDLTHCETIWGSANDAANTYMPTMDVIITAGDFTGVAGKTIGGCDPISTGNPVEVEISGGTYAANHAIDNRYLAVGYALKQLTNGYYEVVQVAGTQTRELVEGWSWFSTYIKQGNDGLDSLQNALNPNGIEIKSREGFTRYYSGLNDWSPSQTLTSVSTTKMYMVKTSADHKLELIGDFENENVEITLAPGWNWIGYPLHDTIPFRNALANLTPNNGDVIKSKDKSLSYVWGNWQGDLDMVPGEGYMYSSKSNTTKTFSYSTEVTGSSRSNTIVEENHWIADINKYPGNMTMIAMLNIDGEIVKDNYEIAAFANGECRGSARPIYIEALDAYVLQFTIQGEEVEELTFKYYDVNYGTEYELSNRINYSDNAIVGSFDEPYMFNLGILNIEESSIEQINIYPNPTTTSSAINLQAMCDKVEVFNALGVKVAEYSNVDSIDALETAGVYVIRVTIDGSTRNCRLVVK